jgi:hypothetical protein
VLYVRLDDGEAGDEQSEKGEPRWTEKSQQ